MQQWLRGCLFPAVVVGLIVLMAVSTRMGLISSAIAAETRIGPSATSPYTATPDVIATRANLAMTQAAALGTISAIRATDAAVDATGTAVVAVPTQQAQALMTVVAGSATAHMVEAQILSANAAASQIAATATVETRQTEVMSATTTAAASATLNAIWHAPQTEQPRMTQAALDSARAAQMAEAWHWSQMALVCGLPVVLIVGVVWLIVAASWRVQGAAGGQAQATVEETRARVRTPPAPISGTDAGRPRDLDRFTRASRRAYAVLERMAQIAGDDATVLVSAPEFGDNNARAPVVAALVAAGLAESVNGSGVELVDHTIGELLDDLETGRVVLPDPAPHPTGPNFGGGGLTGKVK